MRARTEVVTVSPLVHAHLRSTRLAFRGLHYEHHVSLVTSGCLLAGPSTGATAYKTGRDIPTAAAGRGGRSAFPSGARWAPAGAARRAFTAEGAAAGRVINPDPNPAVAAGPCGAAADQRQRSPVRAPAAAAAAAAPAAEAAQPAGFADPPAAAAAPLEESVAVDEQPQALHAAERNGAEAEGPSMAGPARVPDPDPAAKPPAAHAAPRAHDRVADIASASGMTEQATVSTAAGAVTESVAAGQAPPERGPSEGDQGKAEAAPSTAAAGSAVDPDAQGPTTLDPKPAAAAGAGGGIGGLGANLVSTVRSFLPFVARSEPADAVPAAGKKPVKVPSLLSLLQGISGIVMSGTKLRCSCHDAPLLP